VTTDDDLLDRLRHVLNTVDGPRARATEAAKAAIGWRDIDAEFAQLVFDSRIHAAQTDLVLRGETTETHQLTFSTDDITIDIEFGATGLVGQVIPASPATIELIQGDNPPRLTETDAFGAFSIEPVRTGPTTMVVRAADGAWSVRAAWTAS
jgi:hypothetical protein